jgi:excisionase family DNA binding protein
MEARSVIGRGRGRPVLFRAGARRDPHRALGIGAAPAPDVRVGIDPLLTAEEVAGLLQVTTAWVYAQTRARRIPHVPLGRYVRYRQSAVLEWLTELERQSCVGARVPMPRR